MVPGVRAVSGGGFEAYIIVRGNWEQLGTHSTTEQAARAHATKYISVHGHPPEQTTSQQKKTGAPQPQHQRQVVLMADEGFSDYKEYQVSKITRAVRGSVTEVMYETHWMPCEVAHWLRL